MTFSRTSTASAGKATLAWARASSICSLDTSTMSIFMAAEDVCGPSLRREGGAPMRSSLSSGGRFARLDPASAEEFEVDGGYLLSRAPPAAIGRHPAPRLGNQVWRQADLLG